MLSLFFYRSTLSTNFYFPFFFLKIKNKKNLKKKKKKKKRINNVIIVFLSIDYVDYFLFSVLVKTLN